MDKSTTFTGQPIFSQLLKLVPRDVIQRISRKHSGDRYVKHFNSYEHLVSMLFCVFEKCSSLREVCLGLQGWGKRIHHLGIKSNPKRSTLAEANRRRPAIFFEELFHELIHIYFPDRLPDSRKWKDVNERLRFIDSTTMELFSDVMGGAGLAKASGKKKGGVKVHTFLNAAHDIPEIVFISEAKENDRIFLNKIKAPVGSILVFDRGYFKYSQWQEWTDQGLYWVTRMKQDAFFQVLDERPVNETQKTNGVVSDQLILLGRGTTKSTMVIQARRIVYYDEQLKRTFEFVTNHEKFSSSHIADLYRKRWQIETFFKSIKQNYQLRYFLGETENAIRIQIWCSLIADLLIKIIKHQVKKRSWAVSNLRSLIRIHLGTYANLWRFLKSPEKTLQLYSFNHLKQTVLFNSV